MAAFLDYQLAQKKCDIFIGPPQDVCSRQGYFQAVQWFQRRIILKYVPHRDFKVCGVVATILDFPSTIKHKLFTG